MPQRLRRLDRVFERFPIYFITACTDRRKPLLANAEIQAALEKFAEQGPAHGAWLGAYVLMPDHLHAFVALHDVSPIPTLGGHRPAATTPMPQLSLWMKSLKNSLSKILREQGHEGPHWQKGFFDHILRSSESYGQKWDYVRQNPVRAGLVSDAQLWPYAGQPFPLEYRHDFL